MKTLKLRKTEVSDIDLFFIHQLDIDFPCKSNFIPTNILHKKSYHDIWMDALKNENVNAQTIICHDLIIGYIIKYPLNNKYYISFLVGKKYRKKGIGTRSVRKFLLLETERPLYIDIDTKNEAAIKIINKSGFKKLNAKEMLPKKLKKKSYEETYILMHSM